MTSDESAFTTAGTGPSDETEIVPSPTQAAPEQAWSAEEPESELDGSWRVAFSRAAVPLFVAAVVAFGLVVAA